MRLHTATVIRRRKVCGRCGHKENTVEIPSRLCEEADLEGLLKELEKPDE